MALSNLSNIDKKQFLYELKDYLIPYRDTINVDKKCTFGVEIEFVKAKHTTIEKIVNTKFKDDFLLVHDKSLNEGDYISQTQNIFGGEVKSKILTDEKRIWKNLENVCNMIKENEGCINDNCGGHIHVGSQILENKKNLKRLLKLWTLFEDIIYHFSYGENLDARNEIMIYAKPISNDLKEILEKNKKINPSKVSSYFNFSRMQGLCFFNTFSLKKKYTDNTIEFRCPNGTLNHIIWQNNINFFVKLLLRCTEESNWDIINKYLREYKSCDYILSKYKKLNIDKALLLSDFVFEEEIDKKNFIKQYIKNQKITY